jgi:hypothetical protein
MDSGIVSVLTTGQAPTKDGAPSLCKFRLTTTSKDFGYGVYWPARTAVD